MIFNLEKFFASENEAESLCFSHNLSDVEVDGVFPFVVPIEVCADFRSFSATAVLLDFKLSYSVRKPCDRCLEESEEKLNLDYSYTIVTSLHEDNHDERYILAENKLLDLDELVYSTVMTELPTKSLCSPGCKGLCSICGANLNEKDCGCAKSQVDPRLEILRKLMDNQE